VEVGNSAKGARATDMAAGERFPMLQGQTSAARGQSTERWWDVDVDVEVLRCQSCQGHAGTEGSAGDEAAGEYGKQGSSGKRNRLQLQLRL
jgi:hypothetical protein